MYLNTWFPVGGDVWGWLSSIGNRYLVLTGSPHCQATFFLLHVAEDGPAQPPAPFLAPSGLPRRPPARNRPDNARAARSSGFLGPTWEGERQGGASRKPGLARSRSSLLHNPSLDYEQADRSVNQVCAPKRPVWGTGAPPLHTHQRGNSLMNLSMAVVHHGTAAAREASLEKQDPHLAKRRLWTWSQKRMCEVMLSQRRALD